MQRLLYIFFTTLLTTSIFQIKKVNSQVNIEDMRNKNNSEISFGANLNIGNNNVTTVDISTLVLRRLYKRNFLILKANYNKGFKDSKDFIDNYFGHIRLTSMVTKRIGFELFSQAEGDDFKSLYLRQLNGIGIRLEVYQKKTLNINLGLGIMSDYEKVRARNSLSNLVVIRSTSYLSFMKRFKDSKNKIVLTSYVQPTVINPSDIRLTVEFLIRLRISDDFSIYIDNSASYRYDSRPPIDIGLNDFITKSVLTYEW